MSKTLKSLTTLAAIGGLAVALPTTANAQSCGGPAESKNLTIMADWLPWASQGPMMAAQIAGTIRRKACR